MNSSFNPFRHQLASTSPIRWRGLARALWSAALRGDDRSRLVELLRRQYGVADAVLCGSGTEALGLALEAAERLRGEALPVALPAFSCFDVAAAAVRFGRPVLFYDVDPRTLGPVPESLRATIEAGAGIAVLAGLFGVPLDWDALEPVLGTRVVLLEDAAQGHGARWQGGRLGGWGRVGVLSFARGKGWTGGSGGAVLIRDATDSAGLQAPTGRTDLAADLRVIARAGAHRTLGHPGLYRIPRALPWLGLGETRFHAAREPSGMPRTAAALLLDSYEAAEHEVVTRRRAAAEYSAQLEGAGIGQVAVPEGGEAGYVRFPVVLEGGMSAFRDPARAAALGAAASYPRALPELPQLARLLDRKGPSGWPGASRLARELVTLPTHRLVRVEERRVLLELLRG